MTNFTKLSVLTLAGILAGASMPALAQQAPKADDPAMKIYRATAPKINDLIHTKLDVRFDYKKRFMYGKEWVTLKPHFYPTDTLRLDAKSMDIKTIAVVKNGKNIPLKYKYEDSLSLAITLDRVYRNNENYTVYIDYTAKPNQVKAKGSAAINDAKGLYFINPDSAEKGKPVQIWTQGETESSSCWFPTIDKPDQKTTDEITMTVPAKYVTLSNGRLASQVKNADGTRTDTWKMELPHAPYLFMMAVGDFKIYHDKWRDKPVDYYLEPKYAPYAKEIFGMTPELIEFYSKTLGVDFPWNKYAQIVVRDYVSGAMENTTATLHGEYVQGTHRDFLDRYYDDGRSTIAHELFHQWFGDYVTCESWSNLTVNESFADFSETIWAEHKYGKDEADAHSYQAQLNYISNPENYDKNLVRFHYDDKEDVFDAVTYQKGGRILLMLRNFLGNDAFYKGLQTYLKTNAFKNGEAQQLRLAMEEASGLDLNWFFNQWYYGAGHPQLNMSYKWDDATKTEYVYIAQTQDGQIFKLPMAVDIYASGKKERHQVWVNDKADTLSFKVASKPDLVDVDADKVILSKKTDTKTPDEYQFEFFNAPLYLDRFEAITFAAANQTTDQGHKIIIAALKDKYYGLRIKAINALKLTNDQIRNDAQPILMNLAQTDENTLVRAAALRALASLKASGMEPTFKEAIKNPSYAVEGAALNAISAVDPAEAMRLAKGFENEDNSILSEAVVSVYADNGGADQWAYIYDKYKKAAPQGKFNIIRKLPNLIAKMNNPTYAQQAIAEMKDFGVKFKRYGIAPIIVQGLTSIKDERTKANDTASAQAADDAIKAINDAK